jgi:hypothetical protein
VGPSGHYNGGSQNSAMTKRQANKHNKKNKQTTSTNTPSKHAQTYKQGNICHSIWHNIRPFGDDTIYTLLEYEELQLLGLVFFLVMHEFQWIGTLTISSMASPRCY